ncbi:hypothetical protein D9M71_592170 [compost metagenome]
MEINREVHGALPWLHHRQDLVRQVVEQSLQFCGSMLFDQVGTDLNFQVRSRGLGFDVVVLDQQHQAEVSVLQLVLVAGIPAYPSWMPLPVRKGNQFLSFEESEDFRANHSTVQLTDRIDMTAEDPHC